LLQQPRWVFLDEATAALDEENQQRVMSIFDEELPETSIFSIGHRPGLEAFHRRTLQLIGGPAGARLRRNVEPPSHSRKLRDVMRQLLREMHLTSRRDKKTDKATEAEEAAEAFDEMPEEKPRKKAKEPEDTAAPN
jgi:putative ATP-binding cassette transporter